MENELHVVTSQRLRLSGVCALVCVRVRDWGQRVEFSAVGTLVCSSQPAVKGENSKLLEMPEDPTGEPTHAQR